MEFSIFEVSLPLPGMENLVGESLDSHVVGRLRHIYIKSSSLIREARRDFLQLWLRTDNADAATLYERMGFKAVESPDATHILVMDGGSPWSNESA